MWGCILRRGDARSGLRDELLVGRCGSYHVRTVLHAELTAWPRDDAERAIAEQQMDDLAARMDEAWARAVRERPTPIRSKD